MNNKFKFYLKFQLRDNRILDLDENKYYDDNEVDALPVSNKIKDSLKKSGLSRISQMILCTNDLLSFYGFSKDDIDEVYDGLTAYLSEDYKYEMVNYTDEEVIAANRNDISVEPEAVEEESINYTSAENSVDSYDEFEREAVVDVSINNSTDDLGTDSSNEPGPEETKKEAIKEEAASTSEALNPLNNTDEENKSVEADSDSIENCGFSEKTITILGRANVSKISELLNLSTHDLCCIHGMNINTLREINAQKTSILSKTRVVKKNKPSEVKGNSSASEAEDSYDEDSLNSEFKIDNADSIYIEDLDLDTRAYNCLVGSNIKTLKDILILSREKLRQLNNLGRTSFKHIIEKLNELSDNNVKFSNSDVEADKESSVNDASSNITLMDRAVCDDLDIDQFIIDIRANNALKRAGINTLKDLLDRRSELYKIKNLGAKSIRLIEKAINDILSSETIRVDNFKELCKKAELVNNAIISDEIRIRNEKVTALFDDTRVLNVLSKLNIETLFELIKSLDTVYETEGIGERSIEIIDSKLRSLTSGRLNNYRLGDEILRAIKTSEFDGIAEDDLKARFMEELNTEEDLSEAIEGFVNDRTVFRYDGKLYYRYQSFAQLIYNLEDKRIRGILYDRLNGETLEDIAGKYDVTRERIRQIVAKSVKKILGPIDKPKLFVKEDKYAYFYQKYNVDRNEFTEIFSEKERSYNYLTMRYTKGSLDYESAVDDEALPPRFRSCIEKYLNRDYGFINGDMVLLRKNTLISYFIKNYVKDGIRSDELYIPYNKFLEEYALDLDKYGLGCDRTTETKIVDGRIGSVLSSRNKMFRYYPYEAYDFDALIEGLELQSFSNIEITSSLLFDKYPKLMEAYDIRDEYELHNLLKRVLSVDNKGIDISFKKMPFIVFGGFTRESYIENILRTEGELTASALAKIIKNETGLDDIQYNVAYGRYLAKFHSSYGKYSVTALDNILSDEKISALQGYFTDEFYELDYVKEIFNKVVGDTDGSSIIKTNVNKLGYNLYSKYIVKKPYDATSFFKLKLDRDIVDISNADIYKYSQLSDIFNELKNDLTFIEFERQQYINIKRLELLGVTKNKLYEFVDSVKSFVKPNEIFTINSLRKGGFTTELEDLGFEDIFLESILSSASGYASIRLGTARLFRASSEKLTFMDFIHEILDKYKGIEMSDLLYLLDDKYNIRVDKSKLIYDAKAYGFHYSSIMDKLYLDYKVYYEEV